LSEEPERQPEGRMFPVLPDVHLRDYIAIVLQHPRLVVIVVLGALAIGALKMWSAKPLYEAAMIVRVGQRQGPQEFARDYSGWETELTTYCRIITGRDLARRVAKELAVESFEDLGVSKPEPGLLSKATKWVAGHIPTSSSRTSSTDTVELSPRALAGILRRRIKAVPVVGTNLIQISYSAGDRRKAANICFAIADLFVETEHDRHMDAARRWITWFRDQQAEFYTKVTASEQDLLDFHQKMDVYVSTMEGETGPGLSVLQRTIETLEARQAEVRVKRIQLETELAMLEGLSSEGNPLPANLVLLEVPNIHELLQQRRELRRELTARRMRYKPKHPKILELDRSLSMLEEDIRAQGEDAVQARRERLKAAGIEEKALSEELKAAEARARELSRQLVEYSALKRKADANWSFFDTFVTKAKEADLAASIDAANIELITSEPEVKRAAGRGVRTILLATVMGLVVGVGLALFADYMDTTLATPADVSRCLGLDQLAVLVNAGYRREDKKAPLLAAKDHPDVQLTENFRTLRSNILFSRGFRGVRSIVVTSSLPREGKSTVAANLAVVLAQAGKRVLLIDADMRRPAMHGLFGCEREPGLSDVLGDKIGVEEAIRESGVEKLSFIPAGSRVPKAAELLALATEQLSKLAGLSGRFDYVLFDTPPLTLVDPTLVAKCTGASVLLVVRARGVTRDVVQRSVAKLRSVDARIGGVTLNNFDLRRQGYYGYGRRSRYYDYYHGQYRYYSEGKEQEREGTG